jgi:hypothetical protein
MGSLVFVVCGVLRIADIKAPEPAVSGNGTGLILAVIGIALALIAGMLWSAFVISD